MLLRFTVENFLSFDNEVSLSMVASADERLESHILALSEPKKRRVLRGAAIYGANGHGKTNLVHAMRFIQKVILKGIEVDRPIPVRSFRTKAHDNDRFSTFIFNMNIQGIDYEYGIKINRTRVAEEWLFHSPKGREVRVFERVTSEGADGVLVTTVECGSPLLRSKNVSGKSSKEFFDFIAWGTRANQPFLTEAIERNADILRPVYDWFQQSLVIVSAESEYAHLEMRAHEDSDFIDKLSTAVRNAGIGIDRIQTEVRTIEIDDFKELPRDLLTEISDNLESGQLAIISGKDSSRFILSKNENKDLEVIDLVFIHKRDDGTEVRFKQDEESAGTRRLLHLYPMLFELASSNKTYIVDEIDRKLHPLLAYNMLKSFFEVSSSGQLIFTTHNTHLLDLDLLRRDEIWFVEKNQSGHSDLYSLADLRVRPDVEIKKGYMNGRFGAIPFLGSMSALGWFKQGEAGNVVNE